MVIGDFNEVPFPRRSGVGEVETIEANATIQRSFGNMQLNDLGHKGDLLS